MLVRVESTELFRVAFGLTEILRDMAIKARNAIMFGDYCSYLSIREQYEDIRSTINTPLFMDWKFVEEAVTRKFPTWTEWGTDAECLSMAQQTEDEPYEVVFSDGSTITDDVDVPF